MVSSMGVLGMFWIGGGVCSACSCARCASCGCLRSSYWKIDCFASPLLAGHRADRVPFPGLRHYYMVHPVPAGGAAAALQGESDWRVPVRHSFVCSAPIIIVRPVPFAIYTSCPLRSSLPHCLLLLILTDGQPPRPQRVRDSGGFRDLRAVWLRDILLCDVGNGPTGAVRRHRRGGRRLWRRPK